MIKIKSFTLIALCIISLSLISCAGGSSSTSADIKPASTTTTTTSGSANSVTITLNANGGTINTTTVNSTTLPTAETLGLTRSGYTFIGWNKNQNANSINYRDGWHISEDDFNNDKTMILYAIWRFGIKVTPDTVSSVFGSLTEDSSIVVTRDNNSDSNYYTNILNAVKTSTKLVSLDFTAVSGNPTDFSNCTKLKKLTLSNTAQGTITVTGCSNLSEIVVNPENPNLYSSNGVLYYKNMTSLYVYPPAKTDYVFRIPDGVKNILSNAFSGNTHIHDVSCPDSLETIFFLAFENCTNLQSIILPVNTSWSVSNTNNEIITIPSGNETAQNAAYATAVLRNKNGCTLTRLSN